MTCGLRQAGIDVIAGIDFDKECEETYESNNKGSVFVHSDITTLNVDFLEKKFNVKKNDNELIFVGCINPAKRNAMVVKNEKRFLKQKRNALKNPGYSRHPVKTQASFKRLLKAV